MHYVKIYYLCRYTRKTKNSLTLLIPFKLMEQMINRNESRMISDIRALIDRTRQQVAVSVNAGMTIIYWHIGERINREVLGGERATYGKQIVATLARRLTEEYGKGFDSKSLHRMMRFAAVFPISRLSHHWCDNCHGLIFCKLYR